jgi:hypothetical protein
LRSARYFSGNATAISASPGDIAELLASEKRAWQGRREPSY